MQIKMMYIKQDQNIFVQINISNEVKEKKKNATLMEKVFLAWPKKKKFSASNQNSHSFYFNEFFLRRVRFPFFFSF